MAETAIELVVCDMAGTTVSDGGVVEDSFLDALDAVGVDRGTPEFESKLGYIRSTMGRSKIEVFTEMLGDAERARTANAAFEAAIAARVGAGQVSAIDGAEDVLRGLRAAGRKVCLTTGFSPETQQAVLDQLGWVGLANLVLAPGPGVRGRPHPDLVLTALLRLEVDDVRAVAVVGDTANDLVAGWRAGASIVAGVLTGAHTRAELEAAPHTHLLESVAQLPPIVG